MAGEWYSGLAKVIARQTGRPQSFALALGVILAWIVTGPIFGFSDTWQLVINTGTTIVTFLMVFLIPYLVPTEGSSGVQMRRFGTRMNNALRVLFH